jgi:hypothetical protein
MRLGAWSVRSRNGSGSLTAVAVELPRYKLDLVGVQKVRWDKRCMVQAGYYILFYGKGNKNPLRTSFLYTTE